MKKSSDAKYYVMFPEFENFLVNIKEMFNLSVFNPISAGFIHNTSNEKIHTLKVCVEPSIFGYNDLHNYINLLSKISMVKDTGILFTSEQQSDNAIYYFHANEKPLLNIIQSAIREIINANK